MMRLACLASAAGLAGGLAIGGPSDADAIAEALLGVERMWPGGTAVVTEALREARENEELGAPLRRKLDSARRGNRPFVFAAFGSSISAGHDNVQNQSWPFELQRLLKPTFQQLGFDFEVRQRAAGGYGEMPFAAGCMQARAGEVDALSWEFDTFRDAPCEGKHFMDEASALPGQPVVFAFANERLDFDMLTKKPDERKEARNRLLRNGDDAAFGRNRTWLPNWWYFGEGFVSGEEVQTWASGSLSSVASAGRPQPRQYLQETGAAARFQTEGRGFYTVTVGAASHSVVGLPWYQAREKAFNINWHPGPLGHTLIASQVAHYILTELRAAVLKPEPERRGPGPTADNPLLGKGPGEDVSGLQCGQLRARQCFTGVTPHMGHGTRTIMASKSDWTFQESAQAGRPENLGDTVDQRDVLRGTQESGELTLKLDIESDGQYAVLCGAPCGWWCRGASGYVSAKATRWWNADTWKGFVNDQPRQAIVKNLTARGPRQPVSDLTFTVDGRTLKPQELIALHDELFGFQGKYCPNCQNPGEICQPVGSLSKGKHMLSVRVTPRTLDEKNFPDLAVELLQVMVVG